MHVQSCMYISMITYAYILHFSFSRKGFDFFFLLKAKV